MESRFKIKLIINIGKSWQERNVKFLANTIVSL